MTIAIPVWQERVSPVLDTAARLLLIHRQRGREAGRHEVALAPLSTDTLARNVAELHVDQLLCAALSEPLRCALERQGVQVRSHLCGDVEAILQAFVAGQLNRPEFRMPGCWGNHADGTCRQRRCCTARKKAGRCRSKRKANAKAKV